MTDRWRVDLVPVARLYEESLAAHGTAAMGVGWRDEQTHRLRLAKLAYVIEDPTVPFSVNDLGCGYGAFHAYLREMGYALRHFRGHDISEEMLTRARALHPDGEYVRGSELDSLADFSFACGIFNVRLQETEENWRLHIERTLDNLHTHSVRGFAFNLLSSYVDYREPHLYYGDPLDVFDLCKRRYSSKVSLLHDYPLYEWTIAVRK